MKTAMTAGEHVREAENLLSSRPNGSITTNMAIAHALIANAIELSILIGLAKDVDTDPEKAPPKPQTPPQPE